MRNSLYPRRIQFSNEKIKGLTKEYPFIIRALGINLPETRRAAFAIANRPNERFDARIRRTRRIKVHNVEIARTAMKIRVNMEKTVMKFKWGENIAYFQ